MNTSQTTLRSTVLKPVKRNFLQELARNYPLFLMLIPGTIFLLLFNYLPMFGVLLAFKKFRIFGTNLFENFALSQWVGLENFKFIFKNPFAFLIIKNTVLYNIAFILSSTFVCISFAIALNELRSKKMSNFYQTVYFLPYFLSWIIVGYLIYGLLANSGIINKMILEPMGFKTIKFYQSPEYWPFILVFANLWKGVGSGCIIYLATITGFDPEYFDAAAIDGASKWQQIRHITIPLLVPMVTIMLIMSVGGMMRANFELFYSMPMGRGELARVTEVLDTFVFRALMVYQDYGKAAAVGFYQSAIGFALVLCANWVVKRLYPENRLY